MTNQEQYDNMIIVDSTAPNYEKYVSDCAKYISDYCKGFAFCTECKFMRGGIGCIFNNISPDKWEGFIQ